MRRTSMLAAAVAVFLLTVPGVDAQQNEPRRPSAPMLTNEDVLSPGAAKVVPEEAPVSRGNSSGAVLRNPLAVLESALARIGEVNSVRTRVQTVLPEGNAEIVIESMKPDRVHVISRYGEMITIGRKLYVKNAGRWEVTSVPLGGAQSEAVFDFRAFLKEMGTKLSRVRITGRMLGDQKIDGVETVAYEFVITDASESGTVEVCVGKDGYMRRMFLSGGPVDLKMWFTSINQKLSIEPPM